MTVSLNALKGEMDAVGLANIVTEIAKDLGLQIAIDALPYTHDRVTSFLELTGSPMSELDPSILNGGLAGGVGGGPSDGEEFGSFDPAKAKFAHVCPKCSFQWN
jgi:hypothetical protein